MKRLIVLILSLVFLVGCTNLDFNESSLRVFQGSYLYDDQDGEHGANDIVFVSLEIENTTSTTKNNIKLDNKPYLIKSVILRYNEDEKKSYTFTRVSEEFDYVIGTLENDNEKLDIMISLVEGNDKTYYNLRVSINFIVFILEPLN